MNHGFMGEVSQEVIDQHTELTSTDAAAMLDRYEQEQPLLSHTLKPEIHRVMARALANRQCPACSAIGMIAFAYSCLRAQQEADALEELRKL